MNRREEAFDELVIDFDDDSSELAQSGTNYEILDEAAVGGTGSTIASPTDINANSNAYVEIGPKLCHNASNWVLGVRHLSLSSMRLNDRMANRAVAVAVANTSTNTNANQLYLNDSNNDYDRNSKYWPKTVSSNVKKSNPLLNRSAIMNDISEESAENFDTYHSHKKNSSTHYRMIGVTKIKEKRQYNTPADQIFISEVKPRQHFCDNNNVFHHLNKRQSSEKFQKLATKQSSNFKSFGEKKDYFSEQIDITRVHSNGQNTVSNARSDKEFRKNLSKNKKSEIQAKSLGNGIIAPNGETSAKLSNYKRSVNLVALTAKQELQRYKRQCICESISLIIIVIGLILVITTPFLLIPIWVIPNAYSPVIRNILWLSLGLSVVFLALAATTGNVYWYFDEKSQTWKWFYHCGKGPVDHYWGSTILHNNKNKKFNVSINV